MIPTLFYHPQSLLLLCRKRRRKAKVRPVGAKILVGAVPTEDQLRTLKVQGIQQVIDLRRQGGSASTEATLCEKEGLTYISVPMGERLPDLLTVDRLLTLLTTCPTYLHCRYGCDRSGAIAALYRVVVQGWSLPRAGLELLRYGFNPRLEVLARDIGIYAQELRRLHYRPLPHSTTTLPVGM